MHNRRPVPAPPPRARALAPECCPPVRWPQVLVPDLVNDPDLQLFNQIANNSLIKVGSPDALTAHTHGWGVIGSLTTHTLPGR
eukprot:6977549-Prymnesium_polylepis.1